MVPPARAAALLLALVVGLALPTGAAAHTLGQPKDLQASVTGDGVALTWTASSDGHVDGYNVYRRTANGDFAGLSRVTGTSYTDAGATGGTYHLTAYSGGGDESAPTPDVTAGSAPSSGPAASADVSVTSNRFTPATVDVRPGATVTWHFDAGTHTVSADAGQAESFDSGAQSAGTFAHTFAQEGRYTYVCRRHSGMDGVVIVRNAPTTPDTTAPATPAGLAATPGDGTVTLDWADVGAADLAAYRVERQNLDGSWSTIAQPTASTFADGGLANGATYAYRVGAVDLNGNQSAPTDPATATPAAAAVGPAERQVTVGGYAYGPESLVVNRGDTVVWSWTGPDTNHTVTAGAGQAESFESHPGVADGAVSGAPGGGFRHTFTSTGTFSYLCRVHPDMTATVTVVEGGADGVPQQRQAAATPTAQAPVVAAASNHVAKVAQYRFTPASLTVEQGDSVTWQWTGDDKDHSVSAKPGQADAFDSHAGLKTAQIKDAPPGGRFVHVFSTLGAFTYVCRLHPDMVGTVTVVQRSSAAPLRLRGARARVRGTRISLRLRLAEPARVRAQLRGGTKLLRSYRFSARRGTSVRSLALPRATRRGGTFRLVLQATRASGDRAAPVAVAVRVPRR
jgi:plastocyanin